MKELALQQRTELQAALVCTITEMQPGEREREREKNHSTQTKQANYDNNATVEKVQCDHSLKLTERHNSAL